MNFINVIETTTPQPLSIILVAELSFLWKSYLWFFQYFSSLIIVLAIAIARNFGTLVPYRFLSL